jgi:hypothetical protein
MNNLLIIVPGWRGNDNGDATQIITELLLYWDVPIKHYNSYQTCKKNKYK